MIDLYISCDSEFDSSSELVVLSEVQFSLPKDFVPSSGLFSSSIHIPFDRSATKFILFSDQSFSQSIVSEGVILLGVGVFTHGMYMYHGYKNMSCQFVHLRLSSLFANMYMSEIYMLFIAESSSMFIQIPLL